MKIVFLCFSIFLPFICLSQRDSLPESKLSRLSCALISGTSYHAYHQNTSTVQWSNNGNNRLEAYSTFNGTLTSKQMFAFLLGYEKQCNKWLQYQVQAEINTYKAKTALLVHQTYLTLLYPNITNTAYDSVRTTPISNYGYRDELGQQGFIPSVGLGAFKSSDEWIIDLGLNLGAYIPMGGYIRRTYEGNATPTTIRVALKSPIQALTSFKLKISYCFNTQHALNFSAQNTFMLGHGSGNQKTIQMSDALVNYSIAGIQSTTFGLGYTFFLR